MSHGRLLWAKLPPESPSESIRSLLKGYPPRACRFSACIRPHGTWFGGCLSLPKCPGRQRESCLDEEVTIVNAPYLLPFFHNLIRLQTHGLCGPFSSE